MALLARRWRHEHRNDNVTPAPPLLVLLPLLLLNSLASTSGTFEKFMAALGGSQPLGVSEEYCAYVASLFAKPRFIEKSRDVTHRVLCDERARRVHDFSVPASMSSRTLDQLREIFGADVSDEKLLEECTSSKSPCHHPANSRPGAISARPSTSRRATSVSKSRQSPSSSQRRADRRCPASASTCATRFDRRCCGRLRLRGAQSVAARCERERGAEQRAGERWGRHHMQARARVKVEPGSETSLAHAGPARSHSKGLHGQTNAAVSNYALRGSPLTAAQIVTCMRRYTNEAKVPSLSALLNATHSWLVLDNRIDEFAELVREHYHIDELGVNIRRWAYRAASRRLVRRRQRQARGRIARARIVAHDGVRAARASPLRANAQGKPDPCQIIIINLCVRSDTGRPQRRHKMRVLSRYDRCTKRTERRRRMVRSGRSDMCRPSLVRRHRDADWIHSASPAQIDAAGED
ncbi:DNA-directed DNA polymerase [Salix suchowensis]|nr:DNA-directed DNA polymerase [Salix suchowensis]